MGCSEEQAPDYQDADRMADSGNRLTLELGILVHQVQSALSYLALRIVLNALEHCGAASGRAEFLIY